MSTSTWILDAEDARVVVLSLAVGTAAGSLLLAATMRSWRTASAGLRHQLLLLALAGLVALPALAAFVLDSSAPALDAATHGGYGFGAAGKFADMRAWRPEAASTNDPGPTWVLLGLVWLAGAALLMARLVFRLGHLAALRRRCRAVADPAWLVVVEQVRAELGIRSPVRLLTHARVRAPMVWGPPRPFALIPEALARRTPDEAGARLTLLHELAHLERRDSLWKLAAEVVCAVVWFNPLAWRARRHLDEIQEMAADSRVLEAGVRPSVYSSHLLAVFRGRADAQPRRPVRERLLAPGLSSMAGVGSLTERLTAILERGRDHRAPRRWVTSSIGVGFLSAFTGAFALAQEGAAPAGPSVTGATGATGAEALHAALNPVFVNKMADNYIAGAAVSVVKDGELVYAHGFGDAEVFEPVPVSADRTVFRIGSVTKVVTAIAVMQCVDRGLLDLEADVNRYLEEFQVDDTYPAPVRVRHLLTHTAGFDQLGIGRHVSARDEVLPLGAFLKDNLVRIRPPGELTCYDTYGITLAGYLVEVVSGLPYEEFLEQNIFAPLGMERSFITIPEDLRADVAMGYEFRGEWLPQRWEYMNTDPASTVNSTVVDMSRLAAMLLAGGTYGGERILSAESVDAMMTQQFTNHPDQPGYGFILMEDLNYGVPAFSHGGSMTGFGCFLYLVPEERLGLFVAYNQESGGLAHSVIEATVDLMVAEKTVVPPDLGRVESTELEPFLGRYANNMYNHSRPELGGWRQRPFELVRGAGGALLFEERLCHPVGDLAFLSDDGVLLTFLEDGDGRITHLLVQQTVYEKLD